MAKTKNPAGGQTDAQNVSPVSAAIFDPTGDALREAAPQQLAKPETPSGDTVIIKAKRGERVSIVAGRNNLFFLGPATITVDKG